MINIPYRHSDLPADGRITDALSAIRVAVAAVVVALIAAYLLGTLIGTLPISGSLDLVPLDDPAVAALFTA